MDRNTTAPPRKRTLAEDREWRNVRWKRKLQRFQKAEEKIKKFPLGPQYKAGLRRPSPVWRLFPRQKMAFEFARCCKQDVHVFSCEVEGESENGQRKYLVTTYEQFWDMYSVLHPKNDGHFYEVIPEGATCHLYFDLEFSRVVNPGSDGPAMVNTLIKYVFWSLKKKYKIDCTEEQVLDLESSTEDKFSRHLVFRLPGAAFQDNLHAGNFVHEMCAVLYQHADQQLPLAGAAELQEAMQAVPGLERLFVKNKDGEKVLFIDEGVYTKNRNFRLYKNTKVGRRAPLLVAPQCKYKQQEENKISWDKQIFLDSLVSNVSFSSNLKILRCEGGKNSTSRARTSSLEGDSSAVEEEGQLTGYSSSPYPEVDAYVVLQACKGGVQGGIRQWVYFSQGEVLMYDISHNRWCENIGRAHRSNHIMLVADLKRQVFYQKCHDPVCKVQNYKSPERPLPAGLLPAFILEEDDLRDLGVAEEDLITALSQQERSSRQTDTDPDDGFMDVETQEPSDQDLLNASSDLEMITTARGVMPRIHDNASQSKKTVVNNCEVSDEALLAASQCCHDKCSRNIETTVDNSEVSDEALLSAIECFHDNESRKKNC